MSSPTIIQRFSSFTLLTIIAALSGCGGNNQSSQSQPDIATSLADATTLEQYLKLGYIHQYDPQATNNSAEMPDVSSGEAATDDSSYSTTNTGETGIDEADLIKQNGRYLYAAKQPVPTWLDPGTNQEPQILSWETTGTPVSSSLQSTTTLTGAFNIEGLYLQNDQLIALTSSGLDATRNDLESTLVSADYYNPWYWQSYSTDIRVLDLSTPGQPGQIHQLSVEGHLISSRVIDNQLYMVTRYTPNLDVPEYNTGISTTSWQNTVLGTPLTDLLPRVWVNGEQTGHLFEQGDCHVPDLAAGGYPSLVAVIRVNLTNPADWQASCNSGRISGVYASADAFILSGYNNSRWDSTRIDWYDLSRFSLIASDSLPGTLDGSMPSLRLSERNGELRVLTSSPDLVAVDMDIADGVVDGVVDGVIAGAEADSGSNAMTADTSPPITGNNWQHRLFIVKPATDGTLDLVAQLPNNTRTSVIGKPGESVKAVRFFGERAYVVTFRQTDPLYVINLSDSADPFIEGELIISGFSSYLHPVNEHLLLGLGQAADSNGQTQGLKLSLFDTSNSAHPTEITSMELGGRGSWSDALYDHHAISVMNTADGIRLGFTWSDYRDWNWQGNKVFIADINTSNTTIREILNSTYFNGTSQSNDYYWYYTGYTRVTLHNDGLHLVNNGDVTSDSIRNWNQP